MSKRKALPTRRRSPRKRYKGSPEKEYEIEGILDESVASDGKVMYKVKWKGYYKASWEPENNLNAPEMVQIFKVQKIRAEIEKKKVAPSAIGTVERARLCFSALVNCAVSIWRYPCSGSMPAIASVKKDTMRRSTIETLASLEDSVYENAESGMYGRAMVVLAELCYMCKDVIPVGSKLKIYAPLKLDELQRVEYGLMLIVMTSGEASEVPLVVLEIKKEISANLNSLDMRKATQLMLESYYTMSKFKTSCTLGVLTDMTTFHFLLLEAAPGERQLLDVKDTTTHIVAGSYEELLYLAKKCIVHMIR